MHKNDLKKAIHCCHEKGQKVAVAFCSHVPQELLEAAGLCAIRLTNVDGFENDYPAALPKNTCPMVRHTYNICEGDTLSEADLIITESSCDGKKKMYELLTNQNQLYYYQVAQGAEQDYVKPLIRSECRYLLKELKKRFDVDVSDEDLRIASDLCNAERESVMELLEIQKQIPPAAYGMDLYQALEENKLILDRKERILANQNSRSTLLGAEKNISAKAKRILITGCPLGGVYQKVIPAVENNNGVVVCFENCETTKSYIRKVDSSASDMIEALADCYQNTRCAIMHENEKRFEMILDLAKEYQVDGILDVTLQTCHAYSIETDKMGRFFFDAGIPYMTIETDFGDADLGQLTTRIAAFIEML